MHKLWDRAWLRYLVIAVAYAIIYDLLRVVFISHWQLTVGFRLACLLLFPPRYWPALFVGDMAAVGASAYGCMEARGLPWTLSILFLPMSLNMALVGVLRKYWPVLNAEKQVVVSSLLVCILASTVLSTGAEVLETVLMQGLTPEQSWSHHAGFFTYLWLLGTGLGIFMIVPLALWVYTESHLQLRDIGGSLIYTALLRDALAFLFPCLYVLAYLTYTIQHTHSDPIRHIAQIGMLLSPAWLAVRYGWQGASLGCVMANLAVVLSMPALYDPATLQTQQLMMVSSTLWLLLGARVSVLRLRLAPAR